jgi:Lar family restriction alleviation protein
MTPERIKLKPCPFCGGEARTRTTRKMNRGGTRYYVECKHCYASSNPWYDLGATDTKAEAITAWNTRTPDPTHDALVEALEWTMKCTGICGSCCHADECDDHPSVKAKAALDAAKETK